MAAPAYATDLTDITTSFSSGWSLVSEGGGGQNSLTSPETDDYIQGSNCVSRNPFSTSIRGIAFNAGTTTITSDDAIYYWWKADVAQALDTEANGGVHCIAGSSITDYDKYYVAGKDNYALGGWRCSPVDPRIAPSATRGTPTTNTYFGVAWDIPASGPSKGFPFKIDMIRHGRSIDVTAGDVGDPATWDKLTTYTDAIARRWGIVQGTDTGAQQQGIVQWGTASTSVYSRDSNRAIVFLDSKFVIARFTQLIFNNASTDIEWDGMSFTALGTAVRGSITINNNASVKITNSVITDIDETLDGGTNSVWDGTTWNGCNEVTSSGGSFLDCSILSPTVVANTSGFIYNQAVDPDGILDGMSFSEGSNAHHAIEFGTSSPLNMNLIDMDFTGFSASTDVNNSTFHVKRTSGTVNINLINCTGNFGYRTDGATVNLIISPVTLTVTVQDTSQVKIQNARVLALAGSGGSYPFEESVTITRSGATASVSHTGHGMSNGDLVVIEGAIQNEYNGIQTISNVTTNAYDYTVSGSPTTPATGTIIATTAIISGLTDVNGQISDTRTYSIDQPLGGRVRKSTTSPFYKTGDIVGTIDKDNGLSLTVVMLSDE